MNLNIFIVPYLSVTLLLCLLSFDLSTAVSVNEDLRLTASQAKILKQFKDKVQSHLPHEYMKNDIYLIRWLRAQDFNLESAHKMLLKNLEWRKQNKMDTIMSEDWHVFESQYPYYLEGCDREGRPVATASVGAWDVRKAVLSGQQDKLSRYTAKLFEEITYLVRRGQEEGKNITQFSIILNLNDFNLATNFCPACVPFYINWISTYENYYPGFLHKFIFVNAPEIYKNILQTLQPAQMYNVKYKDLMQVYGRNKGIWQRKILEEIPKSQLTEYFGGSKEHAFDPAFLRQVDRLPC